MSRGFRRLLPTWAPLVILAALEIGASFLPLSPATRPLLLIPAIAVAAIVATLFMETGQGPGGLVRLVAVAGLLWLTMLLGLGSLDALTRTGYQLQSADRLGTR